MRRPALERLALQRPLLALASRLAVVLLRLGEVHCPVPERSRLLHVEQTLDGRCSVDGHCLDDRYRNGRCSSDRWWGDLSDPNLGDRFRNDLRSVERRNPNVGPKNVGRRSGSHPVLPS